MNWSWVLRFTIVLLLFSIGAKVINASAQDISMPVKCDSLSIIKTRTEEIHSFKTQSHSKLSQKELQISTPSFDELLYNQKKPLPITFEPLRIDTNLPLYESRTHGFLTHSLNPLLHSETKGVAFEYQVFDRLSITTGGEIGFTSLPNALTPLSQFNAQISTGYVISDRLRVSGTFNVGQFLGERYINPTTSLSYDLNSNWNLLLHGGLYQSNTLVGNYRSQYGLFRAQYNSNGWYLYGQGFTSYANHPYMSLSPSLYNHGYSGFGGGLGYNIGGAGKVSVGIDYIYDPITGKMTPKYFVDLTGAINLGVQKLIELIKELVE